MVTTASALSMLPPEQRIPTQLATNGTLQGGTLKGDLIIIGAGDPSLGSRYLWKTDPLLFLKEATKALKEKGIRHIEGQIIAHTPPSDFQAESPHWPAYDMGNHYAAGAYALNFRDNAYTINLTEYGKKVSTNPSVPGLRLTPLYQITSHRTSDSLFIAPFPLPDGSYAITGAYPAHAPKVRIKGAIPHPPLFLAQQLHQHLISNGIEVTGQAATSATPPAPTPTTIYTHPSPTLRQLARTTNEYSHNLYAEALLRLLAKGQTPLAGHNSSQTAIMALRTYWQGRGMNLHELEMVDGSGLSPENKVTPHFLATLLGKVYRADPSHAFMYTLPLAGREGTLTIFLRNTPLEGKAYLKSGTINHVVCYTGYLEYKGNTYTLAFMVNNFYGRASQVRKAMEQLLLQIFS